MAGYVMGQFTCPKAVTHPSTNRARCRATALIETNALPLHQTYHYTKPPTVASLSRVKRLSRQQRNHRTQSRRDKTPTNISFVHVHKKIFVFMHMYSRESNVASRSTLISATVHRGPLQNSPNNGEKKLTKTLNGNNKLHSQFRGSPETS